ncbi:hypothetical protein MHU86_17540 [Fragilaria crotonensis]|nr:hypothetical protein MHU86_17540 [Fragilaria crotonensis]
MLTYLELFDNRLTGAIPSELYLASSLTRIRLQNNSLSGSLGFQVGQLPGLEELRLGSNSLKGVNPVRILLLAQHGRFPLRGQSTHWAALEFHRKAE